MGETMGTSVADRATYRVSGRVIDSAHMTVTGVLVQAYDRDFFRDQPLGEATTDREGQYEIGFSRADFTGPLIALERHPDLFLRVLSPEGEVLASTAGSVVVDAGRDTRIDVTLPTHRPDVPSGLSWVGGEPVDLTAAAELTAADLVAAYRYWRYPKHVPEKLDSILRAFPTFYLDRSRDDDCGEGMGQAIRLLLADRNAASDLDEADLDNFEPGVTVKEFFTTNVVVKYTTDSDSEHALPVTTTPGTDDELLLTDGTSLGFIRADLADLHSDNTAVAPAYVQKVGLYAEYALSNWISAPFSLRDPRNGATRMEYRILKQPPDIAGGTSGSWSHVEVDVDNSDSQNSFTVPHELLHQVQYRYNDTTTRSGIYGILREGGARFNVESINDKPNRYVVSAQAIFDGPGESLVNVTTGVKNPIRYAAGLFWKYLAEQHSPRTGAGDEPAIGVEAYRAVLEETATVQASDPGIGYTIAGLRSTRGRLPWYGRFDQFRYYDTGRTELDSHETTWANYLSANYLHGTANPVSDRRFEYMEDEEPVPLSAAIDKLASLQADIQTADDLILGRGDSISRTVTGHNPWAARYYRLSPDGTSPPRMLRLRLSTTGGLTDPIIQILRLGPDDALVDIHRSDDANYDKTISMNGLGSVIVIVGTRDQGGDFTVTFDEVASASDVMVTRWNTAAGTEYEVDPRGWAWTWVSPDVMVDTDGDGLADTEVFFDQNNTLKVRLRNRGNEDAANLTIDFWYQKATPYLTASGWIPVTDAAGSVQQVTGAFLASGDEEWFSVDWAPANDGTDHDHWCVKARVTAPGDPNTDNKLVLSNFSNVIVDTDSDLFVRFADLLGDLRWIARGPRWIVDVIGRPEQPEPRPCPVRREACGGALVADVPERSAWLTLRARRGQTEPWDDLRVEASPRPDTYYPVDRRTLPPGVDPEQLVTVAQVVQGEVVGGITYRVLDA
jgi:hypothetical protein